MGGFAKMITDYYRFVRVAKHSATRMDCEASTKSHPFMEDLRGTRTCKETEKSDALNKGDLKIYVVKTPANFDCTTERKADLSVTIGRKNLSQIYKPVDSLNMPFAYGDVNGTSDAIIFVLRDLQTINGRIKQGAVLEVFVCRGMLNNQVALYNMACNGELDEEMEAMREKATLDVFLGYSSAEAQNNDVK